MPVLVYAMAVPAIVVLDFTTAGGIWLCVLVRGRLPSTCFGPPPGGIGPGGGVACVYLPQGLPAGEIVRSAAAAEDVWIKPTGRWISTLLACVSVVVLGLSCKASKIQIAGCLYAG